MPQIYEPNQCSNQVYANSTKKKEQKEKKKIQVYAIRTM